MGNQDRLASIRTLDAMIRAKIRERDRLRETARSVGLTSAAIGDRVQSSRGVSPHSHAVARLVDLEAEIDRDVDALVDLKRECMRAIDQLQDSKLVEILYRRYLDMQTWDLIAEEMGVSRQWALKLHAQALSCLKFTQDE